MTQPVFAAEKSEGTVLITGANRGIGLALAEEFKSHGFSVIGTARKPDEAVELKALGVRVEALDVTDKNSVAQLAKNIEGVGIDILINNAGIFDRSSKSFETLDIDSFNIAFAVNSMGALRVIQGLLPNLAASDRKVIASTSTILSSMELNTRGGNLAYRASKAALNSAIKSLSGEYADRGYIFALMHPGWVKTDLTNNTGNYTTEQSAAGLFKVITGLDVSDNGHFYDFQGKELPW
jgi:NAD(P)-dependent dehydrogenase (short-subunit alcohol dehydrogenase family)